ncbi:DNA-binding MarR family transcriptional regulator [Terracoccus luteus]|uniref:DNA-binding MarR family transcriptional regulator n=1 Tax=Terracoccus luteus TaxID=53356 RepID=A0A495XZ33_9MICO|nr:MarR family transcriptional regulator [Terracoccus luteus]RKT79871.1 DNA-binding MarR family transcriptional regulator [Terracoccus luteus]
MARASSSTDAVGATADPDVTVNVSEDVADVTGDAGEDLLKLDQQVCFALAVAARNVIGLYRPILEPMGLTHPQYLVMLALWERSPRQLREVASALSLEPATLSPVVRRLEAQGLLTRARRPDDERSLDIGLTAEGRRLRDRALEVPPQVMDRLGMGVSDLRELHTALTRVIAATATEG